MTTAAGYISDQIEHVTTSDNGRAPLFWFDNVAPDGDATPWKSAPIGSIYMQKENETAQAALYMKVGTAETDNDWAAFSFTRQFSGEPLGLLLTLTHR